METRRLGVELEVHGLRGLDTDNELVTGNILEDALSDVFELDTNFDFRFIESYKGDKR